MKPQPIKPKPGQESVWDYPRPPRVENCSKHIKVVFNSVVIADTHNSKRVLETSHPPVYYIPPEDIHNDYLIMTSKTSWCEWKGSAVYYDFVVGNKRVEEAAVGETGEDVWL